MTSKATALNYLKVKLEIAEIRQRKDEIEAIINAKERALAELERELKRHVGSNIWERAYGPFDEDGCRRVVLVRYANKDDVRVSVMTLEETP